MTNISSMKTLTFSIIILFFLGLSCSQKRLNIKPDFLTENDSNLISAINPNYSFPHDWLGYWSGELNIYDSTGLNNQLEMALDISKTDTIGVYNWTIIYGADSMEQKRKYQLKELDSTTGHYLIDEKNGILLDVYLFNNELNSIFEVSGNTLFITYKRVLENLIFSVKVYSSKEIRISGNIKDQNQEIPIVNSFKLKTTQEALLHKNCLVE